MDINSNLRETLKATDEVIEELKADIKRGETLAQFKATDGYKDIITEGYLVNEAERLFNILIDPSGANPSSNEEIQLKLAAIGHFRSYVGTGDFAGTIEMDAKSAIVRLTGEELYREEITAEYAASGE